MSQPIPENNPESQTAPPPPSPPAPVPASPAPTPPRSPDGNPFNAEQAFRTLNDTLSALPEQLVNGVREAGQAAAPAPVVNPPAESQAAKKRTFAEWWFTK